MQHHGVNFVISDLGSAKIFSTSTFEAFETYITKIHGLLKLTVNVLIT